MSSIISSNPHAKALLAFVFFMPFYQVSLAEQSPVAVVSPEEIDLNIEGRCVSEDGQEYDMKNLRHISNQRIRMEANDSEFLLTVDLELVTSVEIGKEEEGKTIFNIPLYASDSLDVDLVPDVVVNFAELDHEDYVYWKESYLQKAYLQGLFRFDGDDLVPVCTGGGGTTYIRHF